LKDIEAKEYLDDIESALIQLRKRLIYEKKIDLTKNQKAWDKLMILSDQISKEWKNGSVVEEIKSQR
jgi:hypothetical protein